MKRKWAVVAVAAVGGLLAAAVPVLLTQAASAGTAVSGTVANAASGFRGGAVSSPSPATASPGAPGGRARHTFTNALKDHGPDPFLTYYKGYYYLATTTWNNTVTMRKSATLGGLASATDVVLQTLTRPNGQGTMWAPAFHLLNGPNGPRWYL